LQIIIYIFPPKEEDAYPKQNMKRNDSVCIHIATRFPPINDDRYNTTIVVDGIPWEGSL
jgi:hypothetical protein